MDTFPQILFARRAAMPRSVVLLAAMMTDQMELFPTIILFSLAIRVKVVICLSIESATLARVQTPSARYVLMEETPLFRSLLPASPVSLAPPQQDTSSIPPTNVSHVRCPTAIHAARIPRVPSVSPVSTSARSSFALLALSMAAEHATMSLFARPARQGTV